jgi:hypothetical protein
MFSLKSSGMMIGGSCSLKSEKIRLELTFDKFLGEDGLRDRCSRLKCWLSLSRDSCRLTDMNAPFSFLNMIGSLLSKSSFGFWAVFFPWDPWNFGDASCCLNMLWLLCPFDAGLGDD